MLLRSLTVHNFGGYGGRHVVDLVPPSPDKPVVLFGGLNGAGKTTLLDAMQLALYGRRARCAGRGNLAYDTYLAGCITRSAPAGEGAAVEICFDATFDGATSTFRVHRSWERTTTGAVKEHLGVTRDDIDSMLLADRWDELVEEIMPLDISSLFFFDGEKIEALADPERAGRVIATAVESLLGLNLLDRLTVDLNALERRKRAIAADDETRALLNEIDGELALLYAERSRHSQVKAARRNDVDQAEKALRKAKDRFRRAGGDLYERRAELDAARNELQERLVLLRHDLVEQASGVLPLSLVTPLLQQAIDQHHVEQDSRRMKAVEGLLDRRDKALIGAIESVLSRRARSELDRFLDEDRAARRVSADIVDHLGLDDDFDRRAAVVTQAELSRATSTTAKLMAEVEQIQIALEEADRSIGAIPASDAIAEVIDECADAQKRLVDSKTRLALALEDADAANRTVLAMEARRDKAYASAAAAIAATEDAARTVQHAGKVRDTVAALRASLLSRHLSQIEATILDSLRRLLRKQNLVADLRLDPTTFALLLYDRSGEEVSTERLSAGERQLLAVALLWGLARVSGRDLPTVIDTPLGRLDSTHRRLLVERYFPEASHQVILLSTDEEIDQQLLASLEPRVGRRYELRHDDGLGVTSIADGYFWKDAFDVA